jgi:hypothetical protein
MTFREELRVLFISKPLGLLYHLSFLEAPPGEYLTMRGLRWPLCTRLTADRQAAREITAIARKLTAQCKDGLERADAGGFERGRVAGYDECLTRLSESISRNSVERSAAEARADDESQ